MGWYVERRKILSRLENRVHRNHGTAPNISTKIKIEEFT
jgi:hypothetical protein